jgi:hypothetical protein
MAKQNKSKNYDKCFEMLLDLIKGLRAIQDNLSKNLNTLHFNQNNLIKDIHNLNYRCQVIEVQLEELQTKNYKKKVMN